MVVFNRFICVVLSSGIQITVSFQQMLIDLKTAHFYKRHYALPLLLKFKNYTRVYLLNVKRFDYFDHIF